MKRRDFVMGAGGGLLAVGGGRAAPEKQATGGRGPMSTRKLLEGLEPGTIETIAGVGWREGGEAASTDAGWPLGTVRNARGELIVVDYHGHRIFRIDRAGILHRFAGDGVPGFSGDGGPALSARFNAPHDLWQDRHGNLFVSDLLNFRIRRIDGTTGIVTTVAGCGRRGRRGDGGPALEAELNITSGIATDRAGNLYVADEIDCTVRRVDARTGIITRFAGIGVGGYNGDGIPALEAALYHPEHLALDAEDNLYICDNSNDRIRRVDRRGIIETVAGNPFMAQIDGLMSRSSAGDGGPAREALILMPDALFVDRRDDIYIGEKYGYRIRRVDARTGRIETIAGTGVPGFGADGDVGPRSVINSCESGLWVDDDRSVFWGDCSGRLRRVDGATGIVRTVLGGPDIGDRRKATEAFLRAPAGIAVSSGTLYFADGWNHRVRAIDLESWAIRTVAGNGAREFGGDGEAAVDAMLGNPYDVALDAGGNLFIADSRRSHVRRVDASGVITSCVGNGFPWDAGDGGAAVSARVTQPLSVAVGPEGDLYVGDGIGRIRRVDGRTRRIATFAGTGIRGYAGDGGPAVEARITQPFALAFGPDGTLYFADSGNHAIRRVDREGRISTIVGTGKSGASPAGRPGTATDLASPRGVAVGSDGTVYVADTDNHRILALDPAGRIDLVAGAAEGGDGPDGPADRCRLNRPHNLALAAGCLLISDYGNNRIRAVKLARRR
jgi:sugar lactone lactonase YvrE